MCVPPYIQVGHGTQLRQNRGVWDRYINTNNNFWDVGRYIVMGPTLSLAGTGSLKFVSLKESFPQSRSIVPQLHTPRIALSLVLPGVL
jgi:hypothetical protein